MKGTQTESEGIHASGNKNKAGVAKHIRQNGLKATAITRDKEGHFIIVKGSVQQEDVTLVNICVPNIGAPKHIKQIYKGRD